MNLSSAQTFLEACGMGSSALRLLVAKVRGQKKTTSTLNKIAKNCCFKNWEMEFGCDNFKNWEFGGSRWLLFLHGFPQRVARVCLKLRTDIRSNGPGRRARLAISAARGAGGAPIG